MGSTRIISSRMSLQTPDSLEMPVKNGEEKMDDSEGGIGSSDEQISQMKQELRNVVCRLLQVGPQSACEYRQTRRENDSHTCLDAISSPSGKSSLIHHCPGGVRLAPRSSLICFRVPTEIYLKQSPPEVPWQCSVSVRFMKNAKGALLLQPRSLKFGLVIYDANEVGERLKCAQIALLNPSQPCEKFLLGPIVEDFELSSSQDCVSVQIQGPKESNLCIRDFPRLIASMNAMRHGEDCSCVL
ncbi:hypothetical protein DFH11DRAFT_1746367 [Phellopilus nigrolimitatus]|nr:hypothetical protein DFH11DRAFT_1746367 [Phellopilus nigrolimitatus]